MVYNSKHGKRGKRGKRGLNKKMIFFYEDNKSTEDNKMAPKKKSVNPPKLGETKLRLAIIDRDKCKPTKCQKECVKICPVVKTGKECIVILDIEDIKITKTKIIEGACIGCGVCVNACPFNAISIINLPKDMSSETIYRFGHNTFKLHRLPLPQIGKVLGLVGANGTGKSTALKILAGILKPNLGKIDSPPDWTSIINHYRGSELQWFFKNMIENRDFKAAFKAQEVDSSFKGVDSTVLEELKKIKIDEIGKLEKMLKDLSLEHLKDRKIVQLSGGELQRFAIAQTCLQDATLLIFDEPSSYLDIKQRYEVAKIIRSMVTHDNYIIAVEHDLAVQDYLSDSVNCFWGVPGAYGVVTPIYTASKGINVYLDGFCTTENMRFRDESLSFNVSDKSDLPENIKKEHIYKYSNLSKSLKDYTLQIEEGEFYDSEIIVLLGENGTGKTTFIRMLAGDIKVDNSDAIIPQMSISYKPQILPEYQDQDITVEHLLLDLPGIRDVQFINDIIRPLKIEELKSKKCINLSGGERQRVALVEALGKSANVYLIDEPSAYLDSEQRMIVAKAIKRYIMNTKKTAFIVEHDISMAAYMADKVIVYEGNPGRECIAKKPENFITGINRFLKQLDITFRKDNETRRPRINQKDSVMDREQKKSGKYYII